MKRIITVAQFLVLATVASTFTYGEYWDWNADRIIGDPTVTVVGDLAVTGGLTVSGSSVLDNISVAWDNVSITGGSITGTEITLSSGSVPWSLVTSRPTINSVTVTGAVLDNASNYPTLNQDTTGTAAGLTAQYIDWNSGSGGASIANKPTLGELAALDNGAAIDIAGNAGTASALAANPSDCGAGEYATAIAANGNLTCGTPAGSGTVTGPASVTEDNVVTWGADNTAVKDSGYAFSALAKLASPTFTGTPAAPTAAADTNTTQIATTAFVIGQGYAKLVSPSFTTPSLGVATATTLDTGQGAYELYAMNQNVRTTDSPTFANITVGEIIGTCSPADNDCFVEVTNVGALADNQLKAGRIYFDNTLNAVMARNNDNTATFTVGAQVKTFAFGIDNVIDGDDILLWKVPRALTVLQVDCYASTDNVIGVLQECTAGDVTSCTDVDDTDWTVTNATSGFSVNSGFENAAIAAGAWLKWLTTSEGTTNSNKLSCTVQYRE